MADTFTPEARHRVMSRIRAKNTRPEVMVRKALFARGFRYRINDRRYPGRPDIVLPKYKAMIFVNGCFWHGHDHCRMFHVPSTNTDWWKAKFKRNRSRDARITRALTVMGWRVCHVWECAFRGTSRLPFEQVIDTIEAWILCGIGQTVEIRGEHG